MYPFVESDSEGFDGLRDPGFPGNGLPRQPQVRSQRFSRQELYVSAGDFMTGLN